MGQATTKELVNILARRGKNEGSIFKRSDDRWCAYINLGWQDGRRRRKYFYGKKRREVQRKLTVALSAYQLGLPVMDERITLAEFLDDWYKESVVARVSPKTRVSYERQIYKYIIPYLGRFAISKLAPQHVQQFVNHLSSRGLSPASVRLTHAVLRCGLSRAERWGIVSRNVAKLVDLPRKNPRAITPLTPEQARELLEAAKGDRMEALYTVAVSLGLRQGEALGLRWQDIDLDAGTLRVNFALQRVDGILQLVEPKTTKSRRGIILPELAIASLKNHKAIQNRERLLAGKKWQENGFVFTTSIGSPVDARNLYKRHFKPLLRKAGLPDIRFHDLRHTAATLLLTQGVNPRVVMDTLGHSQIGVTMNTYSHVLPVLQRDAAEKMDLALAGRFS